MDPNTNNANNQADQQSILSDPPKIDINALQSLTQAEMANRPANPTPFTQGANGVATAVEEDPLAKLMSMVKDKGGQVDPIKVKKLFVVVKNKINNEALKAIVESCKQSGIPEQNIINFLLELDRMVETGEIDESFFEKAATITNKK